MTLYQIYMLCAEPQVLDREYQKRSASTEIKAKVERLRRIAAEAGLILDE